MLPPSNDRSIHTILPRGMASRRLPTTAMPAAPPPTTMASALALRDGQDAFVPPWFRRMSQTGKGEQKLFGELGELGLRLPPRRWLQHRLIRGRISGYEFGEVRRGKAQGFVN